MCVCVCVFVFKISSGANRIRVESIVHLRQKEALKDVVNSTFLIEFIYLSFDLIKSEKNLKFNFL